MKRMVLATCAALAVAIAARAETLLDQTNVVVAPSAPSAVQRDFDVTVAGAYDLTLTDLALPAALSNVRAAVWFEGGLVGTITLGANASANTSFNADAAGHYTLSIVGTPGAAGIGTVGARVRRGTDAPLVDISETIELPNPPAPLNHATLDATFAVTDAGDYRVSLADLGFPLALTSARLSVVREGGSGIAAILNSPGSATFTATPGNYRLFVIADADATANAGALYADVRNVASDAPAYQLLLPVGQIAELGSGALTAGVHTLTGTDLNLPAALGALKLAVTSGGQLIARLDAPGSVDFSANAATHEVLAVARAATNNSGSYAVDVKHGGASDLSFVDTTSDGAAAGAVTLSGTVATAGTYRLRLTDFAFPQAFTSLRAAISQGGASVNSLNTSGSVDVDLAAGTVRVLVFGVANTSSNGLYGVELKLPNGTGAALIEANRGVGTAFDARKFSVTTMGRYQVFADDLEFPQRFAGLDAVITRGPDVIGSFFGGGSFIFNGTPGDYFINFIAKPGAQSGGAGTYRMRVATAPNLPTVTLNATPATVRSGNTTQLSWTSTDATQCQATGAWSGIKATTGSETTAAIATQSTFTIECTGPGGSANTQLVVNVSAPNAGGGGGGGGGGALGETALLALLAAAAVRARGMRRTSHC